MLAGHPHRGGLGAAGAVVDSGRRRALSAREKARLPVTTYDGSELRFAQHKECCICLSAFESEDLVRQLPTCQHVYHAPCVDAWLDVSGTCPLCKADVKLAAAAAAAAGVGGDGDGDDVEGREERGVGAALSRAWGAVRQRVLWPPAPWRQRRARGEAEATGLHRMAAALALPGRVLGRWPVSLANLRTARDSGEGDSGGGTLPSVVDGDVPRLAQQWEEGEELQVIFHDDAQAASNDALQLSPTDGVGVCLEGLVGSPSSSSSSSSSSRNASFPLSSRRVRGTRAGVAVVEDAEAESKTEREEAGETGILQQQRWRQ